MDVDTASAWLLIVVSTVLSIFLVFAITGLVYLIKLIKQLRQLADHAENVAESVESAADSFRKTATPLAILKVVGGMFNQASRSRRKKG